MVRRNSRPSPLSQTSVTGLPTASGPAPCCLQTVSASGSFTVVPAGGDPAELGIERHAARPRATAARSAAISGRRSRGSCVSDEVVDAAALERDRAGEPRRLDRDARRGGERGLAGDGLAGDLARHRPASRARAAVGAGSPPGGRLRAGLRPAGWPGCGCGLGCWSAAAAAAAAAASAAPSAACRRKYCQPISTIADSTMARIMFFWSFMSSVRSALAPPSLAACRSPCRAAAAAHLGNLRSSDRTARFNAARRPIST